MESNNLQKICSDINEKYSEEAIHTAFSLLLKMLQNIASNPNEPKFRQFKKTNEAIKTKILVVKEIALLLKEIGYEESDSDILTFKEVKTDKVKQAIDIIQTINKEAEEKIRHKEIQEQAKKNNKNILNDEVNQRLREEAKKKAEIQRLLEYDKQERLKREKATDSKGNDLKFGANLKKFECSKDKGG